VQTLKGVEGEYVFFAAYLQKKSEQENCDVNDVAWWHRMISILEAFCSVSGPSGVNLGFELAELLPKNILIIFCLALLELTI
jgi:hypothetical protein